MRDFFGSGIASARIPCLFQPTFFATGWATQSEMRFPNRLTQNATNGKQI
jgi:hypothetical protein